MYSAENRQRDQCCSGDCLPMHILYMETRRHKFKRQLPESQLVQEDPEKVVQENWSEKEGAHSTNKDQTRVNHTGQNKTRNIGQRFVQSCTNTFYFGLSAQVQIKSTHILLQK